MPVLPAISLAALLFLSTAAEPVTRGGAGDWTSYGRTAANDRRTPLTEIGPGNLSKLRVVWRYHTGEIGPEYPSRRPGRLSATPLAVDGRLYLSTPFGRVVALDGASGREIWRYDAGVDRNAGFGDMTSRGVSYWADPRARAGAPCARRILAPVIDARIVALDLETGLPCAGFGEGGVVSLRSGLRNPPADLSEYELTSPPAIVGDVVVVGSAIADNGRLHAASGEVRGLDVRTGRELWRWDPIPQRAGQPGHETWQGPSAHRAGGANTWTVMAADPGRDLVFLPTSSPSVDYWGGARLGDNRHANSIVALRAKTGQLVWAFQTVHHDLWDYDNAAPPALIELERNGETIPALLQATKSGQLFVLDRRTGRPVFPVVERPVPPSDAIGERASPTQPFSSLPALSPLQLTAEDIRRAGGGAEHVAACLAIFEQSRHEGPFTPPSERGSVISPSNIGGAAWGGVAYDPLTQTVFTPVNRIASLVRLIPRGQDEADRAATADGERIGLEYAPMRGSPYVLRRELFTVKGRPCTPAPYGSLHAISLKTQRSAWETPLGSGEGVPGLPELPAGSGMVTLGGPLLTSTGLLFIGGSPDGYLRAFDTVTGRELWKGKLPAGARSTPMSFQDALGRQRIVVAAGGDGEAFGASDEIVAFGL